LLLLGPARNLNIPLHDGGENVVLQVEGSISIDKYLGVDFRQRDASSFDFTQPFLIERISKCLGMKHGRLMRNWLL
jgi:hypothetical protein